jgi:hypothetical protein
MRRISGGAAPGSGDLLHKVVAATPPASPRSPRGAADMTSALLAALPSDLLAVVLDALPLDAAARARCVTPAWRLALRAPARWRTLDLSAAATASWSVCACAATLAAALEAAAAATHGAGATSVDLSGHPLDGAWLFDMAAREAARPGGGALAALAAPDVTLAPAAAAAICELLPSLTALRVSLAALGSEDGTSLAAALAAPALRAHAFTLSSAFTTLSVPPHALAAALAPHAAWLTRLDVSASCLRDAHVAALATALGGGANLREIDLSENALTPAAAPLLAAWLLPPAGGPLARLDLSGNALGARGVAVLQAALLAQHAGCARDHADERMSDAAVCVEPRRAPLRRLVAQCVGDDVGARAAAAALAPRTHVACGFGAHAWRLWGSA